MPTSTRILDMTQTERRNWLIEALLAERPDCAHITRPTSERGQRALLRGLFNVRPPDPVSDEFLAVQDAYLQARLAERGVTSLDEIPPPSPDWPRLRVWRGDITTLATDAIVNAANSRMLGCFIPNHGCIDNAIHSFAGVQLRAACARIMDARGREEPTGTATITPAFNLPARYVLHTVGPIVRTGVPSREDRTLLAGCYRSCLELACERCLQSVAFCCISTGEFCYPQREAAQVAIETVSAFLRDNDSAMEVVFNVFKNVDHDIYLELLEGRR